MATGAEPTTLSSPLASQRGPAALAVTLSVLLFDAAVETFVTGSPVRWWVAGIVAAYVALGAFLWQRRPSTWQRFGWSARASASFFLLLGLLTFTAWLPSGLTDGIRLLAQPTSRVLSLLTTAVIALAGTSLVRLSWLPRWAKVVIGLLTAYGLAAFLKGIISGTEFAALLHGESLWTRLPSWLQGAFLGAFVIVPAGFLLHIAHLLRPAGDARRTWEFRQVIAMAVSIAMVISGVTNSAYGGAQPSAAEIVQPVAKSYQELGEALAGPKPKTPPTADQVADKLEKLFPMLEKAEREIPRDTFDMQAVIDKVGKDPQKLFEWVRDNTYFVPYRGLLRGDKGVLMDRLGDSLDRAMLLYAMLRNIGQSVRLARGTLTEVQAQDVLKKARPFPSFEARTGSASFPAATDALIKQYANENHLNAARIRKAVDQLTAQQQHVRKLVQKRVAAQTAMVAAAVGRPPKSALAAERANQIRAVTDHWWVQWQNASNWIDFDPTLPDTQPSKTLTAAQTTPTPNSYTDLGDDLLHTVQIQVVIEVWKHGQVSEIPVLTQKLLPADLIGVPIVLRQIPVAWPQDLNRLQEKNPLERFKQTVLAQTEWMPVLSVGSQNISRYSFNDYGDLNDSTLPGYIQNVMAGRVLAHKEEEATEGLGKAIGGMLGGSQGSKQPKDQQAAAKGERTQVMAEWIDYELHMPGQPNRTVRRELFDLLGPAARASKEVPSLETSERSLLRRGFALLSQVDVAIAPCDLSADFAGHLRVMNWLNNRQALDSLLRGANSANTSTLATQASKITAVEGKIYRFLVARAELRGSNAGAYFDRPNIVALVRQFRLSKNDELVQEQRFDIVANDIAVQAKDTNSFLVRLQQGVLDTNAEAVLAAQCYTQWRLEACEPVSNAAETLAHTSRARVRTIHAESDPIWQAVALSRDVRQRMKEELAAGDLVIIPETILHNPADTHFAWWRVNVNTGTALGIGESGAGQVTTEKFVHVAVFSLLLATCLDVNRRCHKNSLEGAFICAVASAVGLLFEGWAIAGLGFGHLAGTALGHFVGLGAEVVADLGTEALVGAAKGEGLQNPYGPCNE